MLLDWTGRNPPSMGKELSPIRSIMYYGALESMAICGSELVWKFKKYFRGSSAGTPNSMRDHAKRSNRK